MSLRFGTIQSCLSLMVVLSCQRDRARKRDLAALGLAFLTHLDRTTTARTPRRLHCSSSRVYPADVRELARPARQPSRGRAVVPYDVRRGAAGSGFPNVPVPGAVRRVPSVRMDHYYRGAMLKDKNSSRSEAQPQGARRRASGAGRSRPSNGTPRADGENAPHASFGWDPLHI
jgi:hypothetical protein